MELWVTMRKIKFKARNYYHLYNRGVNRQPIFFQDENWGFFVKRLRKYCQPDLVDIIAYCLMPNHYHLLVYLKADELSEEVMQPFGVSYIKAINRQQKRVGPLFQGPFKAKHVDQENYLLHLSRYIHLNPVRAGLAEDPRKYRWSSCNLYCRTDSPQSFLYPEKILVLISDDFGKAVEHYQKLLFEGLQIKADEVLEDQEAVHRFQGQLSKMPVFRNLIQLFFKKASEEKKQEII